MVEFKQEAAIRPGRTNMTDFSLNTDGDIYFDETGDMATVEGPEETAQAAQFRLLILRGELFEDTNLGVPWVTDMVDPAVDLETKKQIIRSTVLSAPGAAELTELKLSLDTDGSIMLGSFTGITTSGEEFVSP